MGTSIGVPGRIGDLCSGARLRELKCPSGTVPAGSVAAMPTPEFVTRLRSHVGHQLLWLSSAAGVVFDDDGKVLLGRRSDTGTWALPGGIVDPAEQPADAAIREIFEETGVLAVPECLIAVSVSRQITYRNGDVVQYLELTFRCRAVGGEARVNDSESVAVGWHAPGALPDMPERTLDLVTRAASGNAAAAFAFSGVTDVLGSLPDCAESTANQGPPAGQRSR